MFCTVQEVSVSKAPSFVRSPPPSVRILLILLALLGEKRKEGRRVLFRPIPELRTIRTRGVWEALGRKWKNGCGGREKRVLMVLSLKVLLQRRKRGGKLLERLRN